MTGSMDYDQIADLYDQYVQVDFDLPFFLKEARQAHGDVLELMSGTGRVSLPLLQAGVRLTCVDASAAMLAALRKKLAASGFSAQTHQMDVRHLELGRRFELILLPFNAFAELVEPADQLQALQRIHAHLSADGVFICTLHNPGQRLRQVDGQLHLRGNYALGGDAGRLLLWSLENYDEVGGAVSGMQFYELYGRDGLLSQKRMLPLRFALIAREAFEDYAAQAGFQVDALFGDYSYAPFEENVSPFMIWKLRRDRSAAGAA